jgi:hypothetical protein
MDDLSAFCCQNEGCPDHGRRGHGNLRVCMRVRKTGRLVGVNKDTVVRYSLLAGAHARQLHDELVAFSPSDAGGAVR